MGDACHHHHADGPPGEADIERALAVAGDRLTAEGERMTPARSRVLALLLEAGEPVKAYDLIARFAGGQQQRQHPAARGGHPLALGGQPGPGGVEGALDLGLARRAVGVMVVAGVAHGPQLVVRPPGRNGRA